MVDPSFSSEVIQSSSLTHCCCGSLNIQDRRQTHPEFPAVHNRYLTRYNFTNILHAAFAPVDLYCYCKLVE